ncbi:MAG: hypothetical protein KDJ65_00780 [Anaerolineae bacterium]|nr:hypothetical protein [Anaerolineae bacterium]
MWKYDINRLWLLLALAGLIFLSGCTLASPIDRLVAYANEPTANAQVVATIRPTFTATALVTATPTKTSTPTVTPIPTDTPTPTVTTTPTTTRTPTPGPTSTPTVPPPPPPPTNTPEPTPTPAPSWDYQVAEMYNQPTEANILSIMVAIQTPNGGFIPGLRLVGVDPNGVLTKSEISADKSIGHTPPGEVVKSGNTKFEPISNYVTGPWTFHLESADGTQVSDTFSVHIDAENRSWFFFRFAPG